ncbi:MAG: S41 family peptidase [Patescibacteria group bacterium]
MMPYYTRPNISVARKKPQNTLIVSTVLLFFVFGFWGGYFLGHFDRSQDTAETAIKQEIVQQAGKQDVSESLDFNLFWQVWDNIKNNYVDNNIDDKNLFYGALSGLVYSLNDPYSIFFDPEEAKGFEDAVSGTFEGIGAEIGIRDDHMVIISPLVGSPAETAGLLPLDAILAIDGTSTTNMSTEQAVELIKGEKGTDVVLTIKHKNEENSQDISITRNTIKIDSVTWEMLNIDSEKIAYINIVNFNDETSTKFNEAIKETLLTQPKGIILDLRSNPGGLLSQSIEIASRFIPEGVILNETERDGSKNTYKAIGNASLTGISTVVLVNSGSASASEIVAGALQDYNIAKIVGETTFGKGSVQNYINFQDGSSLKLTVAKWFTPNGTSIDKQGITPDEIIELTKEDYDNNTDPQLDRAKEIILNNELETTQE